MDLNEKNIVYHNHIRFSVLDRIKILFGYKMVVTIVLHAESVFPTVTKHNSSFNLSSNGKPKANIYIQKTDYFKNN